MSFTYNCDSQLFIAVQSWQLRRGAEVVIFPCFVQTNISQTWLPISIIGMDQPQTFIPAFQVGINYLVSKKGLLAEPSEARGCSTDTSVIN